MIPEKSDTRWRTFVTNTKNYTFDNLATKMLAHRVHTMISLENTSAKISEAIDTAYNFFSKNEAMVKKDIENIFRK